MVIVMIGEFCLDCWLGECDRVRYARVPPASGIDCPCCQRRHDGTNAEVNPLTRNPAPR
jgi:hypothetical protein